MPKPRPAEVPKKCFGECRPETGCRGKVPKKVLREPRLCRGSIGDVTWSTFFGTLLDTPFRAGTFRSTFSALLLAGASGLLEMANKSQIWSVPANPDPDTSPKCMSCKWEVFRYFIQMRGACDANWWCMRTSQEIPTVFESRQYESQVYTARQEYYENIFAQKSFYVIWGTTTANYAFTKIFVPQGLSCVFGGCRDSSMLSYARFS